MFMNVMEFRKIVISEISALKYIEKVCGNNGGVACPRCVEPLPVYRIEGGRRRRCGGCGHTFNVISGRWLGKVKIPFSKWLWIVKLYELEMTARTISEEIDISYPTVLKAVNTIRSSILAATGHGRELLGGGDSPRCNSLCKCCAIVECESGTTPLSPEDILSIRELEDGCIICTNNNVKGDSIICGGVRHNRVECGSGIGGCRIFLAGDRGRWSFIKERLAKFHGIREDLLPVYLAVIDYRYQHRGEEFFDLLMNNLCSLIPSVKNGLPEIAGYDMDEVEYLEIC